MRVPRGLLIFFFPIFLTRASLEADTRRVPEDFPTIKGAVLTAQSGDIIEVADGYYFENNIIIDKKLTLKARNPLRAIVHGVDKTTKHEAIFVIRAEASIEGFILKNGDIGILQRGSPDAAWTARNLLILNMSYAAVSINAVNGNLGRGRLSQIIVDNCGYGFMTNDAFSLEVTNCLVANCCVAFTGFDHLSFFVDQAAIWNCRVAFRESPDPLPAPQTSSISRGKDIIVLDLVLAKEKGPGRMAFDALNFLQGDPHGPNGHSSQDVSRGLTLTIAGDIYLRLHDSARSMSFYEGALRLGYKAASEEVIWRAHAGLAAVSEQRGNIKAAISHYGNALKVMEKLREKLLLRFDSPGFFSDKMEVYLSLIRLLDDEHKKDYAQVHLEEAFLAAEKSKARGLSDRLEEAGDELAAALPSGLAGEIERISGRISRLQILLQSGKSTEGERDRLLEDLENSEGAYRDLLIRMRREAPAYAARYYPEPIGYLELRQDILDEETALVEFILGKVDSFAFLATRETLWVARLPPASEIAGLIDRYLTFLRLPGPMPFLAEPGGRRLYDLLLGKFRDRLLTNRIRKLILVPDGALHSLPFECLVLPDEGAQSPSRFLIERFEISYSPSATALVRIRKRTNGRLTRKDLLAVVVPEAPDAAKSFLGFPLSLPRLRYVGREIKAISKFFDPGKREIMDGSQAEEGFLKRTDLSVYRFLHFAVHGIFDDDNWSGSGLLLRAGDNTGDDGILQARDILTLKLHSDLVTLSACQTGRGRLESGEGLVGLTGALLFAGSRAVLVSLWPISDRSTADFMGYFYAVVARGESPSRALQKAKIKMLASNYRHPYHWAGFVLVGDGTSYSISK